MTEQPRWLDDRERAAWMPFVQMLERLPQALDRQLRTEAGVNHVHYQVLAMLSEAPDRQLRMSELARVCATSLSRLSHAVAGMETKGWVRRTPCPEDGRAFVAALTDQGVALLEATAPGHVAEVRRRIFDRLTPEQVDQLGALSRVLLQGL